MENTGQAGVHDFCECTDILSHKNTFLYNCMLLSSYRCRKAKKLSVFTYKQMPPHFLFFFVILVDSSTCSKWLI